MSGRYNAGLCPHFLPRSCIARLQDVIVGVLVVDAKKDQCLHDDASRLCRVAWTRTIGMVYAKPVTSATLTWNVCRCPGCMLSCTAFASYRPC